MSDTNDCMCFDILRITFETALKLRGGPSLVFAHSLGNNVFRYFLEWLKLEIPPKNYVKWLDEHINAYFAVGMLVNFVSLIDYVYKYVFMVFGWLQVPLFLDQLRLLRQLFQELHLVFRFLRYHIISIISNFTFRSKFDIPVVLPVSLIYLKQNFLVLPSNNCCMLLLAMAGWRGKKCSNACFRNTFYLLINFNDYQNDLCANIIAQ